MSWPQKAYTSRSANLACFRAPVKTALHWGYYAQPNSHFCNANSEGIMQLSNSVLFAPLMHCTAPPPSSIIQGLCKVIMLLNCLSKVKVLKCRSNNLPVRKTWQHFLKIWINPNFNFALLPWLQVTFSLQDQDSVKTDYILAWREQWEAMQIIHLIFEFE